MATLTVLTGLSLFGGVSYWGQTPSSTSIHLPVGGVLSNRMPRAVPTNVLGQSGQPSDSQLPSTAMNGFCHPLQGKGFLSQGTSVGTHQGRMKYAYDFGVPIGMPVYAMQSGKVIGMRDIYPDNGGQKENADKFNYIWLEHSNGFRSAYIHLQQNFRQKIPVKLYDWVQTGQLIGFSGNSGWSTAPHLHVEVHSIREYGFGQTLPFVISTKCYASPFAADHTSS